MHWLRPTLALGLACALAAAAADAGAKGAKKPSPKTVGPHAVATPPAGHAAKGHKPGKKRAKRSKLAPGSAGTLAHAIASYSPKQPAVVAEGVLPGERPGLSCSADMANVDDRFCIDRWEGSLVEITAEGARAWSAYEAPAVGKTYRAVSAAGVVPQGYISGVQAEAACKAAGKRLCLPIEWRHACAGSDKAVYPYGPTHVDGKCNERGKSPMLVYYPQVAKSWLLVSTGDMNDPRLNQLEGTIAKTGEFSGCANDFGVYDMVGNLHEWTADPNGTFQGGYYLDTSQNGEGCSYRTAAHDFAYHDYSTGFRCCADLQPSSAEEPAPPTSSSLSTPGASSTSP
jgi:hypothetical protein